MSPQAAAVFSSACFELFPHHLIPPASVFQVVFKFCFTDGSSPYFLVLLCIYSLPFVSVVHNQESNKMKSPPTQKNTYAPRLQGSLTLTNLLGGVDTRKCHWLTGLHSLQLFPENIFKTPPHSFPLTFHPFFKILPRLSISGSSLTRLNCWDHYVSMSDANIDVPWLCIAFTATCPYWKRWKCFQERSKRRQSKHDIAGQQSSWVGEDPQANSLSCKQSQAVMNGVTKGHHYTQGWGQPKMIMNMFGKNNITSSGMDGWHQHLGCWIGEHVDIIYSYNAELWQRSIVNNAFQGSCFPLKPYNRKECTKGALGWWH